MLRGKRERRADPYYCAIDMTAFVAIMVVLLFVVETPDLPGINTSIWVPVNLARTQHPVAQRNALREDAIIIGVTHDGNIYFRGSHVPTSRLPKLIAEQIELGAERKIYINADARAQYGKVQDVVDQVRAAGIEKVVFIASEKTPSVLGP